MRDIDITNNSNTILMILWILLPKLWRIWKKKDVFNIYDIPFDLLPIFVLSNGWIRFVILASHLCCIYVCFLGDFYKESKFYIQFKVRIIEN